MNKHSPLPWTQEPDPRAGPGGRMVCDVKGIPVAHVIVDRLGDDAQFIVRAVNNIDRLEAALVEVELQVSSNENHPNKVLANIGRIARAALAELKGVRP